MQGLNPELLRFRHGQCEHWAGQSDALTNRLDIVLKISYTAALKAIVTPFQNCDQVSE